MYFHTESGFAWFKGGKQDGQTGNGRNDPGDGKRLMLLTARA
jgi:hypothetical protein